MTTNEQLYIVTNSENTEHIYYSDDYWRRSFITIIDGQQSEDQKVFYLYTKESIKNTVIKEQMATEENFYIWKAKCINNDITSTWKNGCFITSNVFCFEKQLLDYAFINGG